MEYRRLVEGVGDKRRSTLTFLESMVVSRVWSVRERDIKKY